METTFNVPKDIEKNSGYRILGSKIKESHYNGACAVIVDGAIKIEVKLFQIGQNWHACTFFHDAEKGIHSYGYGKSDYKTRAVLESLASSGFNFPRSVFAGSIGQVETLLAMASNAIGYVNPFIHYFTL